MARFFFVEYTFGTFPRNEFRSSAWCIQGQTIARGRAVFDSQTKFQSENVMADVYLGIAIAGANTLIVMAVAIAFVII
jgi:hypothetical protein